MKKTPQFFFCTTLLLGNAYAFADMANCPPYPCRVAACCPEIEDCCECDVCPPVREITPNGGPCVKEAVNIYLTADFIYWTVREDNLDFAMTQGSSMVFGAEAKPPKGRVFRPETNWRPGFKVGLGHDLCFDGWDVYAEYTWYNLRNTNNSVEATSSLFVSDTFWFVNNPGNSIANSYLVGEGKWFLNFNVLDLEMGRNFYVSPRLMLRPFFGLKGTWQKQTLKVVFDDFEGSPNIVSMKNRMKNWGVGILAGLNTSWHINRAVSVIGNIAVSGLWEQFKVNRFDNDFTVFLNRNTSLLNVTDRFHILRPVIEWMLGARWETWFSCDSYHFSAEAGWEQQVWFSQNMFIRLPGTGSCHNGDLTLQGLTIKLRLDF